MTKLENVNLRQYTSFKVSSQAKALMVFHSLKELQDAFKRLKHESALLILGGGSNVLFADPFDGVVLLNQTKGIKLLEESEEQVLIEVKSGENWHELVQYCLSKSWFGLENLALIPGTVGAAPIQNIGAYGVELANFLYRLTAYKLDDFSETIFSNEACEFGYRDSFFKRNKGQYFIESVQLKLHKDSQKVNLEYEALSNYLKEKSRSSLNCYDLFDAVVAIRSSKLPDPNKLGNAGSFFKNPVVEFQLFEKIQHEYPHIPFYSIKEGVKIPAAWLIDQAGFKGKRVGDVGTYEKQALVLVNHGEASGGEVWSFAKQIQRVVKEAFGIELQPEVNIVKNNHILEW